jgi:hypothetical protein
MSGHEHWNEDALVEALYGVREIDEGFRSCTLCTSRWNQLQAKRSAIVNREAAVQEGGPSSEFLAAQRRAIYARLDRPQRRPWRWAPALVAACLVTVSVFLYHPPDSFDPPQPVSQQQAEISDAQIFADLTEVYSLEQSFEPSAAAPIRGLFEEGTEN